MAKIRSFLAHSWAALGLPIVFATFVANQGFAAWLARATGVVVSPWYTGGKVAAETTHDGYRTVVRRPVFDALIGQRQIGFVQVEWIPAEGASLPASLSEAIDYDRDGVADFTVDLDGNTNRVELRPQSPRVLGLERVYRLEKEKVIRVRLKRE